MALGQFVTRVGTGLQGGLDKLAGGLFQADPNQVALAGMTPQQVQAQQRQALMMAGLGMMAGSNRGQRLGESLLTGMQTGLGNFGGAMDTAYKNAMGKRTLEREDKRDARDEEKWKYDREQDAKEREFEQRKLESQERRDQAAIDAQLKAANIRMQPGPLSPEDRATGELLQLRLNRAKELQAKMAAGKPLTADEMAEYRAIVTGGRVGFEPAQSPWAALMGPQAPGMATPGINPNAPAPGRLLADPRLNSW